MPLAVDPTKIISTGGLGQGAYSRISKPNALQYFYLKQARELGSSAGISVVTLGGYAARRLRFAGRYIIDSAGL